MCQWSVVQNAQVRKPHLLCDLVFEQSAQQHPGDWQQAHAVACFDLYIASRPGSICTTSSKQACSQCGRTAQKTSGGGTCMHSSCATVIISGASHWTAISKGHFSMFICIHSLVAVTSECPVVEPCTSVSTIGYLAVMTWDVLQWGASLLIILCCVLMLQWGLLIVLIHTHSASAW